MGSKIITTARKYLGKGGGFIWDYFAGLARGQSWCVGFVLFVCIKARCPLYNVSKTTLPFWVPTLEEWLHKHAKWVKYSEARAGDIIIFTWHGGGGNTRTGSRDHTGFFEEHISGNKFRTVEGNTSGGKVAERERYLANVYAIYRLPDAEEGDADPQPKPKPKELQTYKKGSTYMVAVDDLNVRTGAGTGYRRKKWSELTLNGQKHANKVGQLMEGTRVTCKKTKTVGGQVWMRIPSGWVCAYNGKKKYIR